MARKKKTPIENIEWDFDKQEKTILKLCGYTKIDGAKQKELLRKIEILIGCFPSARKSTDRAMRPPTKSKHLRPILDAIKVIKNGISGLPSEIKSDIIHSGAEKKAKITVDKKYPHFFSKNFKVERLNIEKTFGILDFTNEVLSIAEIALKELIRSYDSKPKHAGQTKYAEKSIQSQLFRIFDTFYCGENSPVYGEPLDADYVNEMARFTFYVMDSTGIQPEGLGKIGKSEMLNGRLAKAALAYCKHPQYFTNRAYLIEDLQESLKENN